MPEETGGSLLGLLHRLPLSTSYRAQSVTIQQVGIKNGLGASRLPGHGIEGLDDRWNKGNPQMGECSSVLPTHQFTWDGNKAGGGWILLLCPFGVYRQSAEVSRARIGVEYWTW